MIESSSKRQCTSKYKIIYCTKHEGIAKSLDYNVKIKCSDGVIAHTTWGFFSGVEYFNRLINSDMKESRTRELTFEYLDYKDVEIYIELIVQVTSNNQLTRNVNNGSLMDIYSQADIHGIVDICEYLKKKISELPWSLNLYRFIIKYNILDINKILIKYTNTHKNGSSYEWCRDIEVPPMSESIFWNNLIVNCNSFKLVTSWIVCYRFMSLDVLREAITHNHIIPSLDDVKLLTTCPQKDKDSELLLFISWAINKIQEPNRFSFRH